MSVVCWSNGSFGAGKTTLSQRLVQRWPEALVFDAELPGFMLRDIVPSPPDDFQDLPAWRRSVVDTAATLLQEYRRPLLVPMTVVNMDYLREIFGCLEAAGVAVRHFFLNVRPQTLRKRIEAQVIWPVDVARDEDVRRWRLEQVVRCTAAVDVLPSDTVILDGEMPTAELAERVLAGVGIPRRPDCPFPRQAAVAGTGTACGRRGWTGMPSRASVPAYDAVIEPRSHIGLSGE